MATVEPGQLKLAETKYILFSEMGLNDRLQSFSAFVISPQV